MSDANKLLGQTKKVIIESSDGAVTLDPPAHTIEASNDTTLVLSVCTDSNAVNPSGGVPGTTVSDRITTVPVGGRIYGMFSAITVTSGTATCYLVS